MQYIVDQFKALTAIPSPSGFTRAATEYTAKEFEKLGFMPKITNKGCVLVDLGGEGRPLVLSAHIDTLGAMVAEVKPNGRLRMSRIGGIVAGSAEAENCIVIPRFTDKRYEGTCQVVNASGHVNTKLADVKRDFDTLEIVLDEKVKSRDDVLALGINAGDFVCFDPRTTVTASGYIKSRFLDDKLSASILLGLARAGVELSDAYIQAYYDKVVAYVKANIGSDGVLVDPESHNPTVTDNERIILALTAIGKDPANVGDKNLLAALQDRNIMQVTNTSDTDINGLVFGLLALNSGNYTQDSYWLVQAILTQQNADGSWSANAVTKPVGDVDMTAMALQALAPYYNEGDDTTVNAAVDKALQWLSAKYKGTGYTSAESCAQVVVALSALQLNANSDSSFVKTVDGAPTSVLGDLLRYYLGEGQGFKHAASLKTADQKATEQALYAMAAYERYCRRTNALYDMTDAVCAHSFGDWQVVSPATCTADGSRQRVCTRCGASRPETRFVDVKLGSWYYNSIVYAVSNGLMNGVGDSKFEPEEGMTRAMLVTVLWRYEGSPKQRPSTFSDVRRGQWYSEAVSWAAKNGIVTGVGDNKFEPDTQITREQIATILYRYAQKKRADTSARGSLSAFPDNGKVNGWAKTALQWCVGEGLIGGTNENGKVYLDPQGTATRAQVATILMRYIEKLG